METQFYVHLDFPAAACVLAHLSYSPDTPRSPSTWAVTMPQ
ncbi:hypothetical protein [Streptomyces sp. NPDC048392]